MTLDEPRLIKITEVLRLCAISRSALYEKIAQGTFPQPVRVGERAVAWRQSDVLDWIASRPPARVIGERHLNEFDGP